MAKFNRQKLRSFMGAIEDVVGADWLSRKVTQEMERRKSISSRVQSGKNVPSHQLEPHPLVLRWIFTSDWLQSDEGEPVPPPEQVFQILTLGMALSSARAAAGFERITSRLKSASEFHSASFEALVAANYLQGGCGVEFIAEDPNARTPDLLVTTPAGNTFWAECKCRDEVIEREKLIRSIWSEIQGAVRRALPQESSNVLVEIKCLAEPSRNDIAALKLFVLERILAAPVSNVLRGPIENLAAVADTTGKYLVRAQVIAPFDESIEAAQFEFSFSEEFDYSTTSFTGTPLENGLHRFRNPSHYAFTTETPSDGVPGVVNAFKSAVKQLPHSGPGVVCLNIPNSAWGSDFAGFIRRVLDALRGELSGEHNQRVNVVSVFVSGFGQVSSGGERSYRFELIPVEHIRPRAEWPKG